MTAILRKCGFQWSIALFGAIVLTTTISCASQPVEPEDDTMTVLSNLTAEQQIMTLGVVRGSFDTGGGVLEQKNLCYTDCIVEHEGNIGKLGNCKALCDCVYDKPTITEIFDCFVEHLATASN